MKITAVLLCLLFAAVAQAQQIVTEYKQTDSGTVRIKKEISEKILSAQKVTPLSEEAIAELNNQGKYNVDAKNVLGFLTETMYELNAYPADNDNFTFTLEKKVYPAYSFDFLVFFIPVFLISLFLIYGGFFDKNNSISIRWLGGTILLILLGTSVWFNISDYYHNPLRKYLSTVQLFSSSIFILVIFAVVLISFVVFRKIQSALK